MPLGESIKERIGHGEKSVLYKDGIGIDIRDILVIGPEGPMIAIRFLRGGKWSRWYELPAYVVPLLTGIAKPVKGREAVKSFGTIKGR